MILITGATGHLGSSVIENLLKKISFTEIIAFVRDEKKATTLISKGIEIRVGDYSDVDSINKALKGINKLLLISSNSDDALNDHKNMIDAAVSAGVNHIYYTSGAWNSEVSESKLGPFYNSYGVTEKLVKESGMKYTIFQNALYADTLEYFLGKDVVEKGVYFPSGDGKTSFAKREEMGEAIAGVLASDGHENKIYPLTGNDTHTFGEIAKLLSELSGQDVYFYSPDKEEFEKQLRHYKVQEEDIFFSSLFGEIIRNNEYNVKSDDLEKLLGRKPTSLRDYLDETFISRKIH